MSRAWLIAAASGLIAGAIVAAATVSGVVDLPRAIKERITGEALVGGPFELIDHNGRTVSDRDFRGQYMLIYFGFTQCPDICPSALQLMSAALDGLSTKADKITPILISLDPQRDTPEVLAAYVSAFHPRLVGLTGSPEAVDAAASAYRVYYRQVADPANKGDYTVDHSSILYLMGPDGKFITHFTHGTPLEALERRLQALN